MQLDLGFLDRPEANVWDALDNEQRAVVLRALVRLMIKADKKNPQEENDNAGQQ